MTTAVPIKGPPPFRPATRLFIESSHRPAARDDAPAEPERIVPIWLRELRRDTREQVL